jgi:hypothetical protein
MTAAYYLSGAFYPVGSRSGPGGRAQDQTVGRFLRRLRGGGGHHQLRRQAGGRRPHGNPGPGHRVRRHHRGTGLQMRRPGTSLITTSILLPYLFYHQLQKRTTVLQYGSAADTVPTSDIDVWIWFFSSFVKNF